jgi:hypothetical protein
MLGLGSGGVFAGVGGVSVGDGFAAGLGAAEAVGATLASGLAAVVVSACLALESDIVRSAGVEAALSVEGCRSGGLEQPAAEMPARRPVRNKAWSLRRRGVNMYLSLLHCIIHRFVERVVSQ